MISKEVEEAIKNCNMLLAGDITVHIIDDDGGTAYAGEVNKTYNDDLKTVLSYIEDLEKQIPTPSNEVPVEYQTSIYVDKRDAVMKDKIRDKIKELDKEEQELQNSISEEEREEYSDANISFLLCDIETRRKVLKSIIGE